MPIIYQRPQYLRDTDDDASLEIDQDASFEINVRVELWRVITYIFFYIMVLFAILVTRFVTVGILAEGVDKTTVPQEQWGCGPFNRGVGSYRVLTFCSFRCRGRRTPESRVGSCCRSFAVSLSHSRSRIRNIDRFRKHSPCNI